jgi:hypothetical protein
VPGGRFDTLNCWVPAGPIVAVCGLTAVGGRRVKTAVPRTAFVEALDAVTVTVCEEATELGAV